MPDIAHRIGVKASTEALFAAAATPEGIAGWWTESTTAVPGPEGKPETLDVRFLTPAGKEIGGMAFQVVEAVPGRKVVWRFTAGPEEWIGTEAVFEISAGEGMTVVIFRHRGWKEQVDFMAHCSMKWAVFLLSLRDYCETGKGKPSPRDVKIDDWN